MDRLRVVDSHTAGEPTRVVLDAPVGLELGSMAERLARLRDEHDHLRRAIVCEPRGSDVMVAAFLLPPESPDVVAGVVFCNNVGYLGMCGHGMIGVVTTLADLGRIGPGRHRLETPVGPVEAHLHHDGRVSVANVPAYRLTRGVEARLPDGRVVTGDVAWGGNWFFIAPWPADELRPANVAPLTAVTSAIQEALLAHGVRGTDGAVVDHIELSAHLEDGTADARNFVLCPGQAYDRSPCGTGTCAKLACLHADGAWQPGDVWRQAGILGEVFEASYEVDAADPARILPTVTGRAYLTAEATLLLSPDDPFRWGAPGQATR